MAATQSRSIAVTRVVKAVNNMRQITRDISQAFVKGKSKRVRNTETYGQRVLLHGNPIVWRHGRDLVFTLGGWGTPTTRDRINGIFRTMGIDACLYQHNYDQFFNAPDGYTYEMEIRGVYRIEGAFGEGK